NMLGVSHVAQRLPHVLNAVSGRTAGMIERRGFDPHVRAQPEFISSGEVLKLQLPAHRLQRNGESGLSHLPSKYGFDPTTGTQMPGADLEVSVLLEGRAEEREATDVIPVGMGQQK